MGRLALMNQFVFRFLLISSIFRLLENINLCGQ